MRITSALNQYLSFNTNRSVVENINNPKVSPQGHQPGNSNGVQRVNLSGLKNVPHDLHMILSREEKQMLKDLFPGSQLAVTPEKTSYYMQFGNRIDLKI